MAHKPTTPPGAAHGAIQAGSRQRKSWPFFSPPGIKFAGMFSLTKHGGRHPFV